MNPFKKELIEKINIKSDAIANAFERVIDELAPSQANEAEKLKSVLDAIEKKEFSMGHCDMLLSYNGGSKWLHIMKEIAYGGDAPALLDEE